MDKSRNTSPFDRYISHSPTGPYSSASQSYSSDTLALLATLPTKPLPERYFTIRGLLEERPNDPHLLLHLAWLSFRMLDERAGLKWLRKAQDIVGGLGIDTEVDARLVECAKEWVKLMKQTKEEVAGDGVEVVEKWVPVGGYPGVKKESDEDYALMTKVGKTLWGGLGNMTREGPGKGSDSGETGCLLGELRNDIWLRKCTLDTNIVEGVFLVTDRSYRNLIYHGFSADLVEIKKKTTSYRSDDPVHVITILNDTLDAYKLAINNVSKPINSTLSVKDILDLHETVTRNSCITADSDETGDVYILTTPGFFRRAEAGIYSPKAGDPDAEEVVQVAPASEVEEDVEKLISEINSRYDSFAHGVVWRKLGISAWAHNAFEKIHPFGDGSGRVGRLLGSMILGHLAIDVDVHQFDRYIKCLKDWSPEEDLRPTMRFFLNAQSEGLEYVRGILEEQGYTWVDKK